MEPSENGHFLRFRLQAFGTVGADVERVQRAGRLEVERVVRVSLDRAPPRRVPLRAVPLADGDHVGKAVLEIRALLDDVPPRRPHGRLVRQR